MLNPLRRIHPTGKWAAIVLTKPEPRTTPRGVIFSVGIRTMVHDSFLFLTLEEAQKFAADPGEIVYVDVTHKELSGHAYASFAWSQKES